MYVKPVARHCWLSGLRRRPLRLLRASGMAKDAVDVLKRRLRFKKNKAYLAMPDPPSKHSGRPRRPDNQQIPATRDTYN